MKNQIFHIESNWISLDRLDTRVLNHNLDSIRWHHPDLWRNLQEMRKQNTLMIRQTDAHAIELAEKDNNHFNPIYSSQSFFDEKSKAKAAIQNLKRQSSLVLLVGMELDESYFQLFEQTSIHSRLIFVVLEPDLRLVYATLAIHPFSGKRLYWVTNPDWQLRLRHTIENQHLYSMRRVSPMVMPGARKRFGSAFVETIQSIWQHSTKLCLSIFEEKMVDIQSYYATKDVTPIQSILAIHFEGGMAVPYIQNRFLRECEKQDIQILWRKNSAVGGMALLESIAEMRPDLLLFMNFMPNDYAPIEILNQLRLPRMIWCIDDPYNFLDETQFFHDYDFVFVWDRSYIPYLESKGAKDVNWFPYLADLDEVEGEFRDDLATPVSYIGQVQALNSEKYGFDSNDMNLVESVSHEKSRSPKRSYSELLFEQQFRYGKRIVDSPEVATPQFWRQAIYIRANALRRIHMLEAAMPFGLKLFGNEQWLSLLEDHPLAQCYCGPAHPTNDVPSIFLSSTLNLNIHSIHAQASLNQRDFNCPLNGGFLLSDWVDDANCFFVPDQEMVFYQTSSDLWQKIGYYLKQTEQRQQIIQRGRERVVNEHTYKVFVPKLLRALNQAIADRMDKKNL